MDAIINAANKIYRHEYVDAIEELKTALKTIPSDNVKENAMAHINLAMAYNGMQKENPECVELCNFHSKEALKYGHNTGLAAERLIINLTKAKKFKNAAEVCEVVLNGEYKCGEHAYRQKNFFIDKMSKLKTKMEKHKDNDLSTENMFTDDEKRMIIENSNRFKI